MQGSWCAFHFHASVHEPLGLILSFIEDNKYIDRQHEPRKPLSYVCMWRCFYIPKHAYVHTPIVT